MAERVVGAAGMAGEAGRNADPAEIARFSRLAGQWWDSHGPMRPLHAMNPARIGWIASRIAAPGAFVLDVGCGGGLASEALGRLGHRVLGIDASAEAVGVARAHAPAGLSLDYAVATAESLAEGGQVFDAVVALEIIEHVPDPLSFMGALARLVRPGGRVFVSTLNRTARSLLVAKIGAEYVARLLPRGTHDWRRFVTPPELAGLGRRSGLRMTAVTGLSAAPLTGAWRTSRDTGINYLAAFER